MFSVWLPDSRDFHSLFSIVFRLTVYVHTDRTIEALFLLTYCLLNYLNQVGRLGTAKGWTQKQPNIPESL